MFSRCIFWEMQAVLRVISTSNRRRLGRSAGQLFVFCLVIFGYLSSADAGIMLPSSVGAGDSVFADRTECSDQTDDQAKLKQKLAVHYGQPASSGGTPNSTTYFSAAMGVLRAQEDASPVNLIFRRQSEISPAFTNPFLDGILRPPIARLLV